MYITNYILVNYRKLVCFFSFNHLLLGIDPGTDLRGVGFLGLIHLLYLALNPATMELSKDISKISKTEKQVQLLNKYCISFLKFHR